MDERAGEDARRQCRMRVWPVVYLHECLELFGEIGGCGCGHTYDATAILSLSLSLIDSIGLLNVVLDVVIDVRMPSNLPSKLHRTINVSDRSFPSPFLTLPYLFVDMTSMSSR